VHRALEPVHHDLASLARLTGGGLVALLLDANPVLLLLVLARIQNGEQAVELLVHSADGFRQFVNLAIDTIIFRFTRHFF